MIKIKKIIVLVLTLVLVVVGLTLPKKAEATFNVCQIVPQLCATPTPSASPRPTASPTASPEPSSTPEPQCEVDCEPTATPSPTPVATPTPETPLTTAGAPVCPDSSPVLLPANPHVYRNGANAVVKWFPTAGSTANVYYHQNQNTSNAHAVRDTENDGYVEIGSLGTLDWTFGIQQSQGCGSGNIVWVVDGNTIGWTLFR